jgi:alcohol dehydrogenase class IV
MQESPLRGDPSDASIPTGLLAPFDYLPQTRVVFGAGTVARLGELAAELGGRRIFLVTDKGLRDAGHEQRGLDSLKDAGLHVTVFDETTSNPTTDDVDRALNLARRDDVDLIVGLGGGSSMDCAKGVNFLLSNGGRMEDYWGVGKATKPMLPMIAVPTTAGTGSEAQSFALIAQAGSHRKMACGDKKAACRVAILDPALTLSMPASVTRATGVDALSHALETYVTRPRNAISQLFSRQAWKLLARGLPEVLANPTAMEARSAVLLGAHLAGAAIENSMLGATHALANPLSARFGTTHGVAIGIMLPHVIRYNSQAVAPLYGRLAAEIDLCDGNDPAAGDKLAAFVQKLIVGSGSPADLRSLSVDPGLIPTLAAEAAEQWTATFNPRPVDVDSLQELYRCAYSHNGHV